MKFRKPPVVEVSISIGFEANPGKRDWDLNLVEQYVEAHRAEFPKRQTQRTRTIEVDETSSSDLPKVVSRQERVEWVRLSNDAGSRVLQLGNDEFSFHVLRTPDDTPGYSKVREAAAPKLEEYVTLFAPAAIRHATLHYIDVVEIPQVDGSLLTLREYFPQVVDLPLEPFGAIAALNQQFQVECPVDDGPLFFGLQTLPTLPERNVFRFLLEWHKQSSNVNSLELEHVWQRMEIAHKYMQTCFETVLSPRTLKLFEPYAETGDS